MNDDADSELLRRWVASDREAYAVLVARHHGLVAAACRRQAAPGDEEDCVQAVFLILARKPTAALRAPVLEAWLQRVACFVCRTSRRAAQRRNQAERDAAQASGRRSAVRSEALDHLDDCLLKLPEKQRAAVTLHYLAGQPAEEVAQRLGTSRDNAYQLISRGLAALRVLLARRGVTVAGTALASLLMGEAQAAAATAPASVVTALTAAPTAGATALAQGAMSAMTIAILAPISAAAGLVVAVGTLTVTLAVEPGVEPVVQPTAPIQIAAPQAPNPATTPVQPAAARPAGPSPALAELLEQRVTLDFKDLEANEALGFLKQMTGAEITWPADLTKTITLKTNDASLKVALRWISNDILGLAMIYDGDVIRLVRKP